MGTAGDVQRPMDMVEWEVFYSNIINRFSIDFFADNKSAEMLDKLTGSVHTSEHLLKNFIERRTCIVYGAGPTLAATPTEILCNTNFTHVAADGSARLFLDRKVRLPDILVTDLDGGYETVMACAPKSVIVLHAHGDNMDKIKRVVPRLLKLNTKMVLTTETVQKGKVKNFFGFTDGDRAAWLCRYFKYSVKPIAERVFYGKKCISFVRNLVVEVTETSYTYTKRQRKAIFCSQKLASIPSHESFLPSMASMSSSYRLNCMAIISLVFSAPSLFMDPSMAAFIMGM